VLYDVSLAVVDGVTINAPTVGLSLGWVVALWYVTFHLRGKLHSDAAWQAREMDHVREMERREVAYARELDRVEHDRTEWRAESRIKDAQMAEKDTQAAERDKQLAAMSSVATTVEAAMNAIHGMAGGGTS
jgi:hypothetical protein